METNPDNNIEQNNKTKYSGSWVYFAFLGGLVGLMIAISYLVKWIMG
jgi:hypothetical protein